MLLQAGTFAAAQLFHIGGGARWLTQFPGNTFATDVTAAWRRETGRPLAYVVGDLWLGGNVAYFSDDRPKLFHDGSAHFMPWIDADEVRRRGAVLLWPADQGVEDIPKGLREQFPAAVLRPPLIVRANTLRGEWTWRIGHAVLPPGSP